MLKLSFILAILAIGCGSPIEFPLRPGEIACNKFPECKAEWRRIMKTEDSIRAIRAKRDDGVLDPALRNVNPATAAWNQ